MNQADAVLNSAAALIRRGAYREAKELLRNSSGKDSTNWNRLYLIGQCHRFLDDYGRAVEFLKLAANAAPTEAPVFLALGIAQQLNGELNDARLTLFHAIELDPDYALAFNSLALTQKHMGELDKALYNYHAGCMALARTIVKGLVNDRQGAILKHRDTRGELWIEHAMYGAAFLSATEDGISGMVTPDAAFAMAEEAGETNGGLYWTDLTEKDGKVVRLFLPNYFNTFREALKRDVTYSNLVGERGTVLALLNRETEAQAHFDEAQEFLPSAG